MWHSGCRPGPPRFHCPHQPRPPCNHEIRIRCTLLGCSINGSYAVMIATQYRVCPQFRLEFDTKLVNFHVERLVVPDGHFAPTTMPKALPVSDNAVATVGGFDETSTLKGCSSKANDSTPAQYRGTLCVKRTPGSSGCNRQRGGPFLDHGLITNRVNNTPSLAIFVGKASADVPGNGGLSTCIAPPTPVSHSTPGRLWYKRIRPAKTR